MTSTTGMTPVTFPLRHSFLGTPRLLHVVTSVVQSNTTLSKSSNEPAPHILLTHQCWLLLVLSPWGDPGTSDPSVMPLSILHCDEYPPSPQLSYLPQLNYSKLNLFQFPASNISGCWTFSIIFIWGPRWSGPSSNGWLSPQAAGRAARQQSQPVVPWVSRLAPLAVQVAGWRQTP